MPSFRYALLALMLFATGCASQDYAPPVASDISLAVASFTQPRSMDELLAGYVPEEQEPVDKEVLRNLDVMFDQVLREHTKRSYMPAAQAIACQKLPSESLGDRSPLEYWTQVGECLKVEYLLVPTLIFWQERLGTDMGVTRPAAVTLDVYVVDVAGKTLLSRGHFEEVQVSLSENLLMAPEFLSRGARWITEEELAREGLVEIDQELGL